MSKTSQIPGVHKPRQGSRISPLFSFSSRKLGQALLFGSADFFYFSAKREKRNSLKIKHNGIYTDFFEAACTWNKASYIYEELNKILETFLLLHRTPEF